MTCARCGTRTPNRLCASCDRDVRFGGASAAEDTPESSVERYRCTACGEAYETDGDAACPECGATRRRYIGPIEAGGRA